jgi:exonuclease VII small subunit
MANKIDLLKVNTAYQGLTDLINKLESAKVAIEDNDNVYRYGMKSGEILDQSAEAMENVRIPIYQAIAILERLQSTVYANTQKLVKQNNVQI